MKAVWEGSPASARDVLERTGSATGWAYSTVKTILTRLVGKGALREGKRTNTSFYVPLVSRDQARRSELRSFLDRAFDGTFGSLLQHLVDDEKLTRRGRRKLAEMIEELDQGGDP